MPFGTPGNDVQPQAMLQVFLNIVVFGMEPQAAIEAPRFATYSYPGSSSRTPIIPGRLNLEARIEPTVATRSRRSATRWRPWQEIDVARRCGLRDPRQRGQRPARRRRRSAAAVLRAGHLAWMFHRLSSLSSMRAPVALTTCVHLAISARMSAANCSGRVADGFESLGGEPAFEARARAGYTAIWRFNFAHERVRHRCRRDDALPERDLEALQPGRLLDGGQVRQRRGTLRPGHRERAQAAAAGCGAGRSAPTRRPAEIARPSKSVSIGALPLYGTCVISMPVA